MNFSLKRLELIDTLSTLIKIVPNRTTLPILSTVFIKTTEKGLLLRTTDLEVDMECLIDAEVLEQGEVCVPIGKLFEIGNSILAEDLSINVNETQRMRIKTSTGKYTVMCQKTEEYPEKRDLGENKLNISAQFLNESIKATSYACSKDELKPSLNGVLFDIKTGSITAVATDAHRLVRYVIKQKNEKTEQILIPNKFLSIVSMGPINTKKTSLEIFGNYVLIKDERKKITSRLITEKFPDYESVIPEKNPNTTKLETKNFLNVIRRVSLMSNKTTKQVVVKLTKNKTTITSEDHETGGAALDEIESEHTGEDCTIGFNAALLIEILKNQTTKEINLLTNTALSAAIIKKVGETETETTTLLMPIRI